MNQWLGLVLWLAVTFAAAFVGARFEPGGWYETLAKPEWTPPPWLFGPVWTALYLAMAVAAWMVWKHAGFDGARAALALFLLQLALNAAWSWLFFGMHKVDLALVDIALLWLAILATMLLFWRVRPLAGALLLPYLLWVSFATALNLAIWRLQR